MSAAAKALLVGGVYSLIQPIIEQAVGATPKLYEVVIILLLTYVVIRGVDGKPPAPVKARNRKHNRTPLRRGS